MTDLTPNALQVMGPHTRTGFVDPRSLPATPAPGTPAAQSNLGADSTSSVQPVPFSLVGLGISGGEKNQRTSEGDGAKFNDPTSPMALDPPTAIVNVLCSLSACLSI